MNDKTESGPIYSVRLISDDTGLFVDKLRVFYYDNGKRRQKTFYSFPSAENFIRDLYRSH
ncbi:MAG: hypothetical protein ABIA21_00715 [Candidatus Aenigmatarchaeota archaeon]